jgi:two-component system, response regulator
MKPILLIEDTPDDAELTMMSLKQAGLLNDIVIAEDGVEAVDYLTGSGDDLPALVLLDLKMPRMDGIEVLEQIRANPRTRLLPVVMLTTSKEESDLVNAYEAGANAYVRKPVKLAEFADAVRHVGMFWLLVNEPPPQRAR